ncbi:hypothetical protein TELCIR_16716 [Teladorsagia circumcincta]|uniref:Uncharacterized protein n=1 Tax=Teladorsagia circumcincta TaxID=45464 RepID=A0A2G9TUP4_TELCI|nr:hypothetical protein TELCIR_16716 [Teladorsagia circumcincta]
MAFYLPADSAENISLTINLLLALVVFLLLVSKDDHHQNCSKWRKISKKLSLKRKRNERVQESCLGDQNANKETHAARISREMKTTVEAIAYIAEHMKGEMNDKKLAGERWFLQLERDANPDDDAKAALEVWLRVVIRQLNAKYMNSTEELLTTPATF